MIEHNHRRLSHPKLARRHHARVAGDDDSVGPNQRGIDEPELSD
ncbi:MAG TPA: hypothetical protein VFA04_26375 [Bryobacteraceae bacterium]|nr:hypothetical protein [Bryobacteraceae bacterium]